MYSTVTIIYVDFYLGNLIMISPCELIQRTQFPMAYEITRRGRLMLKIFPWVI